MKFVPVYIAIGVFFLASSFHVPEMDFIGLKNASEYSIWLYQIAFMSLGMSTIWIGVHDLIDTDSEGGDYNFNL